MEEEIKVYIKTDNDNNIVEVNSEIFIDDLSGWIEIDRGNGDRFAHAQSQYFDKPLQNEDGTYNYKYENRKVLGV